MGKLASACYCQWWKKRLYSLPYLFSAQGMYRQSSARSYRTDGALFDNDTIILRLRRRRQYRPSPKECAVSGRLAPMGYGRRTAKRFLTKPSLSRRAVERHVARRWRQWKKVRGATDHHRSHGGRSAKEERRRWRDAAGRGHGRHGRYGPPAERLLGITLELRSPARRRRTS